MQVKQSKDKNNKTIKHDIANCIVHSQTGPRMQQQRNSIQRTLRRQTMREKHVIVLGREFFIISKFVIEINLLSLSEKWKKINSFPQIRLQ